jgi:prepilin-type N-terminal cleavage/methylation domain-containing protein
MKKQKAFTLIELLVVIAVIAMLMGILMPALRAARNQAGRSVCTSHARQLMMCIQFYAGDNDGRTHNSPNQGLWDNAFENPAVVTEYEQDDGNAYWGIAYKRYAKSKEIFHCPSHIRVDDWPENGWGVTYQVFFKYCSYGINGYIANKKINYAFKRPHEVIAFQDHIEQKLEVRSDSFTTSDGANINLTQWRNGGTMGDFPDAVDECFRHQRQSVTAWLDGSVNTIRLTEGADVPRKWYTGLDNNDEW